jgi:hypothetical protein
MKEETVIVGEVVTVEAVVTVDINLITRVQNP